MKHLSAVSRPINSVLLVMVLAKGFTFQIVEEALSTAIEPTIKKEKKSLLHSLIESIKKKQ